MSLVLGIQGPPGNGKTTLCRKGIAEALVRDRRSQQRDGAQESCRHLLRDLRTT